jgi:hypothetical protein
MDVEAPPKPSGNESPKGCEDTVAPVENVDVLLVEDSTYDFL